MKTINDLVNSLNNGYNDFFINEDDELNSYTLNMKFRGAYCALVQFDSKFKDWFVLPSFGLASEKVQKEIMDFIYTTDSNHWFDEPEKKYNIIIGKDVKTYGDRCATAYRKKSNGIEIWDSAKENDLTLDEYIFTESEIEELKSKVSERSAKIIDLGKVEVKDD